MKGTMALSPPEVKAIMTEHLNNSFASPHVVKKLITKRDGGIILEVEPAKADSPGGSGGTKAR